MKRSVRRSAFTLIELLVVVTIIVVLLALLTPALEKAVYQAQLLTCGTNQKMIGNAVVNYAFDHKRFYPFRDLPTQEPAQNISIQAHKLTHPLQTGSGVGNYDLRPMLKPYVPINRAFNDPLVAPADLEKANATGGMSQTTNVYTSLFLWSGWQYTGPGGGTRMSKVGDRFSYTDGWRRTRSFNLLVGDIDCRSGAAYASHPDFMHLTNTVAQDAPNPFGGPLTASQWYRAGNAQREPLDLNFAYDDGSVHRRNQVQFSWSGPDEGMTFIPNFNYIKDRGSSPGGQNHVPIQ